MAYVDLNPIRAAMADTPEDSDYTSLQERITPSFDLATAIQENTDISTTHIARFNLKPLASFDGDINAYSQNGIHFSFKDYLILVDTTGRIQRDGKRGFIPANFAPILQRLQIAPNEWLYNTQHFEAIYLRTFGRRRKAQIAA